MGRKQRSLRRRKNQNRPRVSGKFEKVTSEETSSPVAIPTTSGKKLALAKLQSSSMDLSVNPLVTDGACSSDSLCEMKGLRLIDMDNLLASVTRRASCNVCGSGLTVRENLKNRKCLCTKLTLLYQSVV